MIPDGPGWRFPGCPEPPDWSLDWDRLRGEIPGIEALHSCPQDPIHHAEGDVGTHTRMVCEALAGLPAWRGLGEAGRSILFAAALLHDIAKPSCTQANEDGRITAKGHARRGAQAIRTALYLRPSPALPATPAAIREAIVGLIRHHALPLNWPDHPSLERGLFEASFQARLDWLALLAEADALGRTSIHRAELLDRVALFREVAAEHRCPDAPRTFASDHTRFLYFQGRSVPPDFPAFDDTRGEVLLLSGLPGSGKDTWAREHAGGLPVIALDALRTEMDVDPADAQGAVVAAARERAKLLLREGAPFAWNATNVTRAVRDGLVRLFASYRARISIVYVEAPWPEIVRRNRERRSPVPLAVMERLAAKLEVPTPAEAHEVRIVETG